MSHNQHNTTPLCRYCETWLCDDAWERGVRHCTDGCRDSEAMVGWLVDSHFAFDWKQEAHPPDDIMRAVIAAYAEREGESFDDIAWSVEQECGYQLPEVRKALEGHEGGRT